MELGDDSESVSRADVTPLSQSSSLISHPRGLTILCWKCSTETLRKTSSHDKRPFDLGAVNTGSPWGTPPHISHPPRPRTAMLFILAILAATRASPFGLRSSPIPPNQIQVTQPSCEGSNECRSLGDIMRSCIVTILLCTWVSMHLNIPSPDEKWPRVALRRAGLCSLPSLFQKRSLDGP
jgi:hypothetical protein